jgi:hypothetical protein
MPSTSAHYKAASPHGSFDAFEKRLDWLCQGLWNQREQFAFREYRERTKKAHETRPDYEVKVIDDTEEAAKLLGELP